MMHTDGYDHLQDVGENRINLRLRANCRFVNRDEFFSLVISTRQPVRADEPQAEMRGLLDLITSERFFTEEEELFRN